MTLSSSNKTTDQSSPQSGRCLFILGSGRCGTSAMAGVINLLGVNMGNTFLSGDSGNPRGYWEYLDTYRFHHHLREIMGFHWDYISPLPDKWWLNAESKKVQQQLIESLKRDFGESTMWAVKENRLCRYIKLWEPIFTQLHLSPSFLILFRHPGEVAASFDRKEGLPFNKSLILWLLRNLDVEKDTRSYPRVFVSFDSLLLNWRETIARIGNKLELEWPQEFGQVEQQIDAFLEPRMRHHAQSKAESIAGQSPPQLFLDVYKALQEAETDDADITDACDGAREAIESQTASLYVQNLIEHIQGLDQDCKHLRGTYSWRVTAPLRATYDFIRRMCT